jgi:NADH dehydrogenase
MNKRPRVVIVGGGFGGLAAARVLGGTEVDVTLLDRTNHHVFQPLLYQVATATLAPTDVTAPIRWLLRKNRNTEVLMATAERVDRGARTVILDDGESLPYDYLILAAGARHSYFGHPEWEADAPGLKDIADALEIRKRFLSAFECAERSNDPAERNANLTFVIVGGGPTGVELAGMFPTIARHTMPGEFHRIDPSTSRVSLVEAGPRVLPSFPEHLSDRAKRDLEELGVEVRVNTRVTEVGNGYVQLGDERIDSHTIVWAAGNTAAPIAQSLGAEVDKAGRVKVNPDLSVPGSPEIFVVGDLAVLMSHGKPVPGVAPAAIQSGSLAAENVLHSVRHEGRAEFHYHNKGDLATIGRNRAVAVFPGNHQVEGRLAWWTWLFVHIMYLAGFRNRLSVLVEWGYAYLTYQRGARLISQDARPTPASKDSTSPRR